MLIKKKEWEESEESLLLQVVCVEISNAGAEKATKTTLSSSRFFVSIISS